MECSSLLLPKDVYLLHKKSSWCSSNCEVIWSKSISMLNCNLTSSNAPAQLCVCVAAGQQRGRRGGEKKRLRLSSVALAANYAYCSAETEHIPLCWLQLLLFLHRAALSELLHAAREPVAVRSFLSQSKYFCAYRPFVHGNVFCSVVSRRHK